MLAFLCSICKILIVAGRNYTVIIADDEKNIRDGLVSMSLWSELSIDIVGIAANGQEAWELIKSLQPDFAIMDIKMPHTSGMEAIASVRKASLSTDIIILSGYDSFDFARDAIKYGVKAYLLKPVDESEIKNVLLSLCSKREENLTSSHSHISLSRTTLNDLIEGRLVDNLTVLKLLSEESGLAIDSASFVLLVELGKTSKDMGALTKALQRALGNINHLSWGFDSRTVITILNVTEDNELSLLTDIQKSLKLEECSSFKLASGEIVPSLRQISFSYSKALLVLSYSFYFETAELLTASMLPVAPPSMHPGDLDTKALEKAVLEHDENAIVEEIDCLLDALMKRPYPPPSYVLSMVYSLVKGVESDLEHLLDPNQNRLSNVKLSACKSASELKKELKGIFIGLSRYVQTVYGSVRAEMLIKKNFYSDDIQIQVERYIYENLSEQIRIEEIAALYNQSSSYFASCFKQETGKNLRTFILEIKMEWARKELLKKTTSVDDIAGKLGYKDYRSFSRAFKNQVGQTPSEYAGREL